MRINCDPPSRPDLCKCVCEVWDGNKWTAQNSVTIVSLKQRKEEDRLAGVNRLANAVAVDIRGATGPSASSINGVYTPTDELCSGWPVYRKEGDPDKWLEYIIATNEWYVKPTADRGRSEGWMCLGCEPPSSPELSRGICEVWDGEKWSVQNTVTVLTAACAFENMLEVQIFCAEETRELQERINGLLGKAVGILTAPAATSSSSSGLSDRNHLVFSQTLLSILTGSTHPAAAASVAPSSSSVPALVHPDNNEYIPADKVRQGEAQLQGLLSELDDRLSFLHDQVEDDEDDDEEEDEEEEDDELSVEIQHRIAGVDMKKMHSSSSQSMLENGDSSDYDGGSSSSSALMTCQCKECGVITNRRGGNGSGSGNGSGKQTQSLTPAMASSVGMVVAGECYSVDRS